jgi:hypothetical protein
MRTSTPMCNCKARHEREVSRNIQLLSMTTKVAMDGITSLVNLTSDSATIQSKLSQLVFGCRNRRWGANFRPQTQWVNEIEDGGRGFPEMVNSFLVIAAIDRRCQSSSSRRRGHALPKEVQRNFNKIIAMNKAALFISTVLPFDT